MTTVFHFSSTVQQALQNNADNAWMTSVVSVLLMEAKTEKSAVAKTERVQKSIFQRPLPKSH